MALRGDGEGYLRDSTQEALDLYLRNMDEAGIQVGVIIRTVAERTDNEGLARLTGGNPRLLPLVTANPKLPDAAAEVERAATEWGFRGMKLMAAAHQYEIDDPIVDPLMRLARQLGLVVTIHSGGPLCHASRIIRLAKRHPDVPIIMDHMGFPDGVDEAIEGAAECPNVYLLTTLLRFFRGQEDTFAPVEVRRAVERLGPERVIFGSNQPGDGHPRQMMAAIQRLGLGQAAEDLIFGENLRRIYGLG
jgi:predicted TIM-barrel fold metal-dependent hydrolase